MELDYATPFYEIQVAIPEEYKKYLPAKTYSFEELLEEIEGLSNQIYELEKEIDNLKEDN